jgi:hypothetical protein
MDWTVIFEMQYPHWLMVAGGVLVVVGFIGSAFQKKMNRQIKPSHPRERSQLGPWPFREQ